MNTTIVTITGPSCAGKSTLEKLLKVRGFENAISTTTRSIRESDGEKNGESYFFVDKSEFKRLEAQNAFMESVEFNGNYYGVTAKEIERLFSLSKNVVIVCEPDGKSQILSYAEKHGLKVYSVFVDNPLSVICERFVRRFTTAIILGGPVDLNKSVESYSTRMAEMMTAERSWAVAAECGIDHYDLVISKFGEAEKDQVANLIWHAIKIKGGQYA
jgi:guanylate kinase